jgi:hypothetical protein
LPEGAGCELNDDDTDDIASGLNRLDNPRVPDPLVSKRWNTILLLPAMKLAPVVLLPLAIGAAV